MFCTVVIYYTVMSQNYIALSLKISPVSTSPHLSNAITFPNFIRTAASGSEIVIGIVQAMKQYGWSRIALMTQSENVFTFVSCCNSDELSLGSFSTIHICLFIRSCASMLLCVHSLFAFLWGSRHIYGSKNLKIRCSRNLWTFSLSH